MAKRTRWQPPHPAKNIGITKPSKPQPRQKSELIPENLSADNYQLKKIGNILRRTKWCVWPGCQQPKYHELQICSAHRTVSADYRTPQEREWAKQRKEHERKVKENQAAVERGEKITKGQGGTGGFIYIIEVGDLIKIGYTTQPSIRFRDYPPNAEVLALFPGTKKSETMVHSLFRFALSHGREWFRPVDEIREYAKDMADHYGPPHEELMERFQPNEKRPMVGTRNSTAIKKTAA